MTSPIDELDLMRLHDGELAAAEVERLEARLLAEPEAARRLRSFERVGGLLREFSDQRGRGGDGIADAVIASIEGERASQPRSVPRWRRVAPVAAAVLAMAAAAVLVVRSGAPHRVPVADALAVAPAPAIEPAAGRSSSDAVVQPAVLPEPAEDATPSVAIESVDFGARNGTIFMVQNGETETPVVWLMDDPALPGGRIEPL